MKKSLVIVSFAFIFLLSMSIVSANLFDWITGDAGSTQLAGDVKLEVPLVKTGQTETIGIYDVKVMAVQEGVAEATITNTITGIQEQVSLQEGKTAILKDGATLTVSDVKGAGGFLNLKRGSAEFELTPPGTLWGLGEEAAKEAAGLTETEQTILFEGTQFIDNHEWSVEENTLLIDNMFSATLLPGGAYLLPIPSACYWEVSISETREAIVKTICPLLETGLVGVESGTGLTEKGCIDTDEGSNLKVKGTTYMSDNLVDKWTDNCVSSSKVMEYTCVEGVVTENVRDCPASGTGAISGAASCIDGACV